MRNVRYANVCQLVQQSTADSHYKETSCQCLSSDTSPPPRLPILKQSTLQPRLTPEGSPPSGNFFISPFSVWSALVLAYFGSRGNTKAELEQVLRLTNREDTLALFRALERRMAPKKQTRTTPSTRLTGYTSTSPFPSENAWEKSSTTSELKPRAQCESLPYKRADLFSRLTLILSNREKPSVPDAAAADINAETRGKIPKLIQLSFVKGAKMVLTNAVYFKGFWKYPFKPQRTHKDKFFVTPEESVQVDMMSQTRRF
nr:serine protease inhibitor 77Ba-like [Penaeus vannamei]